MTSRASEALQMDNRLSHSNALSSQVRPDVLFLVGVDWLGVTAFSMFFVYRFVDAGLNPLLYVNHV